MTAYRVLQILGASPGLRWTRHHRRLFYSSFICNFLVAQRPGSPVICNNEVAYMSSDRIEKQILIRAPRARVWEALADSEAFGQWFGVKLEGPFSPGAR